MAGEEEISSLYHTTFASYLEAFFRMVGSLINRLAHIDGPTIVRAAALLADPFAAKRDQTWTTSVFAAHQSKLP